MNKTLKFLILISFLAVLALPLVSSAALGDPLVPCNNNTAPITDPSGVIIPPVPCNFNALMDLANNVVNFVLFGLALPICAIMFAYAGFLMLTAGASTENVGKAKKIFTNAALGLIIAAAAWLIINTIMSIFAITPTDWTWIGFK